MPFELGIFVGARRFGDARQKAKCCLILDRERYRYRNFLSDIAGQDIKSHENDPTNAIGKVREFLRANSGGRPLSGSAKIRRDFDRYIAEKSGICAALELEADEITFPDLTYLIAHFLKDRAQAAP
jgi:hypothetical protein